METRDIFEQMANRYDTEERVKIAQIIANAIRCEVTDAKGKSAMDYGCGTGLVGLELLDSFASMLLVDASSQMLQQVQQKIDLAHINTASTLGCDFSIDLPPAALRVDYVLMSQVLLHIKDTQLILARLYDVLNNGGHLLIVDFNKEARIKSDQVHNGFEQSELLCLVKQTGFTAAHSRTFYLGKKIFMNQDASLFLLNARK